MFKVGDRVRIIHHYLPWHDWTGTIVSMWYFEGNQRHGVQLGGQVIGFGCDEIELIDKRDNKPLPLPG